MLRREFDDTAVIREAITLLLRNAGIVPCPPLFIHNSKIAHATTLHLIVGLRLLTCSHRIFGTPKITCSYKFEGPGVGPNVSTGTGLTLCSVQNDNEMDPGLYPSMGRHQRFDCCRGLLS